MVWIGRGEQRDVVVKCEFRGNRKFRISPTRPN